MGIGILLAMSLVTHATGATCDRNYDASLDRAIATTLSAVAGNNPSALLGQMSRDGVAFGTDGPLLSYAELSSQFSAKTGRYCDLFACGGKAGGMHRLFVKGKIDKQIDPAHGVASVFINANSNDELDLSYRFTTQCKWELTGLGAP